MTTLGDLNATVTKTRYGDQLDPKDIRVVIKSPLAYLIDVEILEIDVDEDGVKLVLGLHHES